MYRVKVAKASAPSCTSFVCLRTWQGGLQFCLSFTSGSIVCLVHEKAAALFVDEAKRTAGVGLLISVDPH